MHDFPDKELGKAIPYGIYDVAANTGWVSVGADHDTSAFAVETLRRWWAHRGPAPLPRRRPVADLRRRWRLQRLPGPRLEDRTRPPRRRDRPDDHRLPPAAGLAQELLDHYRAAYGDDDPATLGAANSLTGRLLALGEHEQARALAEDTLTRRRRVVGEDPMPGR